MEVTPIDKLAAYKAIKNQVDSAYKLAEQEAEDFLTYKRDTDGTTSLTSPVFGSDVGEYHYGKTRAKKVVEYALCDDVDFAEWLECNVDAAIGFAKLNASDLGRWWFDANGELPDGISRVEVEEPSKMTAPKFYKFNPSVVLEKLGGNMFEKVNELLLGDGR